MDYCSIRQTRSGGMFDRSAIAVFVQLFEIMGLISFFGYIFGVKKIGSSLSWINYSLVVKWFLIGMVKGLMIFGMQTEGSRDYFRQVSKDELMVSTVQGPGMTGCWKLWFGPFFVLMDLAHSICLSPFDYVLDFGPSRGFYFGLLMLFFAMVLYYIDRPM